MILYGVSYNGPAFNYDESLVTIHKTLEGAKNAMQKYLDDHDKESIKAVNYRIVEINTDSDSDIVYDYEYS